MVPSPSTEPLVISEWHKSDEKLDEEDTKSDKELDEKHTESDEDDTDSSEDCFREYEYDTEEELLRPHVPGAIIGDEACWIRYFEQIRESEGFDFKDYPGSCAMTIMYPMPHYVTDPTNVERMGYYASQALVHYNEKNGTTYEVNEILKVNVRPSKPLLFYITLSVKNGENEYFQVQVAKHIGGSLDFPIVRPRVKGGLDI